MMDDLLQEMIDPAPEHHDAPRRRRLWTTVAIVGLAAVGATTLTTSAIFTDNDSASALIETGTVDLAIGQPVAVALNPQNLAPGDSTFIPLEVQNNGSLALRYSVSYQATVPAGTPPEGDLRSVLQLYVYAMPAEQCTTAAFPTTRPDALNGEPETPWPGTVSPLVGSSTPGDQGADRELTVGNRTESLCFEVHVPLSTGNAFQDAEVTLDLTSSAEQTVNNP